MPYVNNDGTKIHYALDGAGLPLILQHGFTSCIEDWFEVGYVAALRLKYQLVLIDARGHGTSDKPHDVADYTLERRVADVIAVLDALGIEKAHFWGYSMGGWIGFGVAKYVPQRLNKLVIGGQHPFARDNSGYRQWLRQGMAESSDALVTAFENMVGQIPEAYADRLRTADLQAWLAASEDRLSIEDVLETMTMPCCLYAGDADPAFAQAKLASEHIADAQFIALAGLSHYQAFVESRSILPRVMEFLEKTT
jgi:pimeloyl-ACP methyl ester carboxylesterase